MSETPIICPACGNQRPTYEEIRAYKDAPEGSEIRKRVDAYTTCCNPLCKGNWGTNCWHCHHPSYLKQCSNDRLLAAAFKAQREGYITTQVYWEQLVKLSVQEILDAWDENSYKPVDVSGEEWAEYHLEMTRFAIAASAESRMRHGNALKVKAETIMQCQLAVCEYCRASAESGQTTVHKCVAAPLKEMLNEVAQQLYGDADAEAVAEHYGKLFSDFHEQFSIHDDAFKPSGPSGLKDR